MGTVAEWMDATGQAVRATEGRPPSREDLCTVADAPHVLERDGERQAYACVMDPLIVPFLDGRPATVESADPVTGADVTVRIDEEGARIEPASAVVSMGVGTDLDGEDPMTPEAAYGSLCAYINAFESRETYAKWAAETGGAVTTAIPAREAVGVAGAIAVDLFGGG
ncbi:hypothetical protein BRC83_05630 [Halobacteriales archaeon QS_1_68_17]|nr:MAG: hypothetical protein BRC83_05630 [Halobacteriales archaeon QS_1_68_17]